MGQSRLSRRGPPGFTLLELVTAVLLSSMVILAMAAIYSTVFKFHSESLKKTRMQGGATVSLKALLRDIELATLIVRPTAPCPNGDCSSSSDKKDDMLLGCTNYDPDLGVIDTVNPVRAFQYCVADCAPPPQGQPSPPTRPKCLYYTWLEIPAGGGEGICNAGLSETTCGTAINGGEVLSMAEGVDRDYVCGVECERYFRRPAGVNNIVEVHLRITAPRISEAQLDVRPFIVNAAVAASKSAASKTQ